MKLKSKATQLIDVDDWDALVISVYGKPYNFQQQAGCKSRGVYELDVPDYPEDFENDTVPEIVNHDDMGVSFAAWLARDPAQPLKDETGIKQTEKWAIDLWWCRNFYPHIQMVANDLHAKGLLEAGSYTINIDW